MIFLLVLGFKKVFSKDLFTCNETSCGPDWIKDGLCSEVCMNPACNYDSDYKSDDRNEVFLHSDCYDSCDCNKTLLNNNQCDFECNNYQCGWDLGDCGYCASGCYESDLVTSECINECAYYQCLYSNGNCGWCDIGCFREDFESNVCKRSCTSYFCDLYDINPCNECAVGCTKPKLRNQRCNYHCFNPACDFDSGGCNCNPGCNDLSGECSTNEYLSDYCDVKECGFKDGKCGYCASGCFQNDLGDGICQEKCNNADCNYDFGDCGCSPGCAFVYKQSIGNFSRVGFGYECSLECLVPGCHFAVDFCEDKDLVKQAVLSFLVYQNNTKLLKLDDCECSSNLTQAYLNGSEYCESYSECYNENCLYCMGQANVWYSSCLRQSFDKCLLCDSTMVVGTCQNDLSACPVGYENIEQLTDEFKNKLWCLKEPVHYTVSNYKIVYVDSTASDFDNDGITSTFNTLYHALLSVYATFSKIFLKNREIDFYIDGRTSIFVSDKYDPLNANSIYTINELWIIGNYSETLKTKVYWKDNLKITPLSQKFYIQNIEFIGAYVLNNTCISEFCYYCPLIFKGYWGGHFNDKNRYIDDNEFFTNFSIGCNIYSSVDVFNFKNEAYIENTDFVNFRYQYKSFIRSSGILNLTNVSFYKMQAKSTGSIILLECSSECIKSKFTYHGGAVRDLGAGYDDTETVETGSFIMGVGFGYIFVRNVSFSFNFLLNNRFGSSYGYLLYSKNHLGTISIIDCQFSSNYVNYLIYIDVSTLTYDEYRDEFGLSMSYSQQHLFMDNIEINNNYCSQGIVYYLIKKVVHNIKIKDFFMSNSVAGDDGILVFLNQGNLLDSDISGALNYYFINAWLNKEIYVPPRLLELENITIQDSFTGKSSIYVAKYPHIKFQDIKIFNVKDGTADDIKNIIETFKNGDPNTYFENIDIKKEVPDLKCNEMISISNSEFLSIYSVYVSYIYCRVESITSAILIQKIAGTIKIANAKLTNMDFLATSGIALTITDSNFTILNHLDIHKIINNQESIVKFEDCNYTFIESATINETLSYYSGPFIVSRTKLFILSNFTFINLSNEYGYGGCINLLSGIFGSKYIIKSGNLIECKAPTSKGGAIYIDSINRNPSSSLYIGDVTISNSLSEEGSAIYITGNVRFDSNSMLANLNIKNNNCSKGGTIEDYHYFGNLMLDGLNFINNIEMHGIYAFYSNEFSSLSISNTFIHKSESQVSLISLIGLKQGAFVHFWNVEIFNTAKIAIEASLIKILVHKMVVSDALLGFSLNSNVELQAFGLEINRSIKKGVFISNSCTFYCNDCVFKENYDSIIFVTSSSTFTLVDTFIISNVPQSENLISITSENNMVSNLINCEIHSNTLVSGSLIFVSSSELNLKNVSMITNRGITSSIHSISLIKSKIKISDSKFQFDTFVDYGVSVYAAAGSTLEAENTIFYGSKSKLGNIYGISATINISSCKFYGNSGSDIFTTLSFLSIFNTTFDNSNISQQNTGVVGISSNYKTTIIRSVFKDLSHAKNFTGIAYIYDRFSNQLEIEDCELTGSDDSSIGIYVKQCNTLTVNNSTFSEFYSANSALTAKTSENKCNLSIQNSKIIKNQSGFNGGGVYSENYNTTISNTEISFNKAQVSGGGIYFSSPTCDTCGLYIVGSTQIFNNTCKGDGGAIKWKDFKPFIQNTGLIFNNSAEYGENFASIPAKFGLNQSRKLSDIILMTVSNVPPGKKYTGTSLVFLYDTYGQVVKTENSIIATLSINDTEKSNSSILGTTTFKAKNGIFYVSNFSLTGVPGSVTYLKFKSDNMVNINARNDDNEYIDTVYVKIEFRNCIRGEQIQATACVNCIPGKYSLKASQNCLECPFGVYCKGGDTLIVKNGYWRSSLNSDVIYACDAFEACLEGNETNELGTCSAGYSGILCKSCENGYSIDSDGYCKKCPEKEANIVILIVLCMTIIFLSSLFVKTTLTSAFSPDSLVSIYIKIFTNYLQTVFIVTELNLKWPSYLIEFFNFQRSTATITEQVFSFDCYLDQKNSNDITRSYFIKLCLITCIPFLIFAVSYIFWIFHSYIYNCYNSLKREVFATIIILFFLAYPNIVQFMFSNFSCITIDQMNSYLNRNTAIECWDSSHKKFSLIVAMPGIILWAIGFPTLLLMLMLKNRRRIHLDYYRVVFGFLFNGYKFNKFYWELVIMYRKTILITISVFVIYQSRILQALNVIILLLTSIYLQNYNQPYKSPQLNNMEIQALNIAAVSIYCGLYYLSRSISEGVKIFLFGIILFGNLYFIVFWIYYITKGLVDEFVNLFPQFRQIFKRGDAFEEDFNTEQIVRKGVFFNKLEGENAFTFINLEEEAKEEEFKLMSIEDAYLEVAKRDLSAPNREDYSFRII